MSLPRTRLRIESEMDVARAALRIGNLAASVGFDVSRRMMIATAASELGNNILCYAGVGEMVLGVVERWERLRGVEIVAVDRGPGIDDVAQALEDHFSSGGTLGLGLPGVRRMMDDFEIDSRIGGGTRVVVRKWL